MSILKKTSLNLGLVALISGCSSAPMPSSSYLKDELRKNYGDNAINCGFFDRPDFSMDSIECARYNDENGIPFYLVNRPIGIDSEVWRAFGRDSRGIRSELMYEIPHLDDKNRKINSNICQGDFDWNHEKKGIVFCVSK